MAGFVLPVISGLAGLFGGGQQQKTQTNQTQNQSQNSSFNNTNSSTPNLNPFQQQLASLFSQGAMNQYNSGTNLAPYTSQGLQQIQGQGAANSKTIANNLAARGLSFSPAAATSLTQSDLNTGNQMNTFLQGIPLLQHQLQQGNLQQLFQAFATQPYGVTQEGSGGSQSSGTGSTSGTSTVSGNPLGGLLGGLGAGLAAPNSGGNNLSAILKAFGIG